MSQRVLQKASGFEHKNINPEKPKNATGNLYWNLKRLGTCHACSIAFTLSSNLGFLHPFAVPKSFFWCGKRKGLMLPLHAWILMGYRAYSLVLAPKHFSGCARKVIGPFSLQSLDRGIQWSPEFGLCKIHHYTGPSEIAIENGHS